MLESYSRDAWAELGVDVEFVQHNHSRSAKGTLRGIHFQTEPGQAKLVRCARGEILDVAVDLRRDSPTYGQWEAHLLDDVRSTASSSSRSASATASPCSATSPTSPTWSPASTTRRPSPGSPGMTPTSGSTGGSAEPLLSERDKSAPRLAEIAETLPYELSRRPRRPRCGCGLMRRVWRRCAGVDRAAFERAGCARGRRSGGRSGPCRGGRRSPAAGRRRPPLEPPLTWRATPAGS